MPPRSKISQLPQEIRDALNKELISSGFSDYEGLERWLDGLGYQIGKSSINRHGQNLERKLAAIKASTEAATAIAEAAPDDSDLRSAAVISLVQTELFDLLVSLQEVEDEDDPAERAKLVARVAKSAAELSRASVNQKKWQAQTEARIRAEVAETVEKVARENGVTDTTIENIRAVLGIKTGG